MAHCAVLVDHGCDLLFIIDASVCVSEGSVSQFNHQEVCLRGVESSLNLEGLGIKNSSINQQN